jgi:exonuclease SbcD
VFYSGTPLAYSFSEEHPKSVCCVEMGPDGACSVEIVPVPVGRRVATISGTIEELLDPSSHPDAVDAWVRAIVTNRETVLHARARLETLYPHLVETLQQPDGRERSEFTVPEVDTNLSPLELALEFWRAAEGDDAPSEIRDELVESLESAVSAAEAAAR